MKRHRKKRKKVNWVLGSCLTAVAIVVVLAFTGPGCASSQSEDSAASRSPYPGVRGSDVKGEKNFATLINSYAQGKPARVPWAGFWWPYTANGIASGVAGGGSPAGKYDAARGGTTNAQAWEVKNHGAGVKNVQGWWGHCNGWCAAAALYEEPKESKTVNGIEFTVADQKGLLSEAGMMASADYYGERVDPWDPPNTPKYDDTIPDQYFLVLTNYMGKLKQPVLIDRYTGDQVWNQPLAGYKFEYPKPSDYLGADPSAPGVYRIMVNSTIWWEDDGVSPGVITPPFDYADNETVQSRQLRMEVWVDAPVQFDANGKITSSGDVIVTRNPQYSEGFVGGAWRMGDGYLVDAWPDYMWIPYSLQRATPDQDYANPEVDIEWVRDHVLAGVDDTSVHPRPVESAPVPHPSSHPTPEPSSTDHPTPHPTATPTLPIPDLPDLPTPPPPNPVPEPTHT